MGLLLDAHFQNTVALEELIFSGNNLKGTLDAKDIIVHRQLKRLGMSALGMK